MGAINVGNPAAVNAPLALSERHRPAEISQFLGLPLVKEALTEFIARPYPSAWAFWGLLA